MMLAQVDQILAALYSLLLIGLLAYSCWLLLWDRGGNTD